MKNYVERTIQPLFTRYFAEPQVIVITGMRRVGKTTFLKHAFKNNPSQNKLYLNLEDILTRKVVEQPNYQAVIAGLSQLGLQVGLKPAYIYLDEIQFSPQIPTVIKYLYDEYQIKFVVTGSSSYYLKNHFTESLAGRKFVIELRPLTFIEFLRFKGMTKPQLSTWSEKVNASSEIEQARYASLYAEYVQYGGFPDVVLQPQAAIKDALLNDIINSYFQIDITTLAQFQDVAKLRDLLLLLTQRLGRKLNISSLANTLGLPRTQVYEYLELLKSTYVIDTISQKSSLDNRVAGDDKLYFSDTGLARLLANVAEGSLFENSVYMNLVGQYSLSYYQTDSGGEIDFVLDNSVGVEVKESIAQSDLATLNKRLASAKLTEGYLVGRNLTSVERSIMAWDLIWVYW